MTAVSALNSDQIGNLGIGTIVGLVVIGAVLVFLLKAVVTRIIVTVVVIALGILVWQQRATIQDRVAKCQLDMTYLGVHVQAPDDVVKKCRLSR